MPKQFNVFLLVLAALLCLVVPWALAQRDGGATVAAGSVPEFIFMDANGNNHRPSEYNNKTVLWHFWATWCGYCRKEFPELLAMTAKNPNVVLIAVSIDEDKRDMMDFLQKQGAPAYDNRFVFVHDPNRVITHEIFGVRGYPETFILRDGGTKMEKIHGATDWLGWKE